MKIGLIASVLIHVAGLAIAPSGTQTEKNAAPTAEAAAASCHCDYEVTVTDTRPPRALTLGEVPAARFAH